MIALLVTVIVRYMGSRSDLIEEEGRDEVVALAAQSSPNLGFYVVVLALAFLSPKVAAFGFLAIAIFAIGRVRGEPRSTQSQGYSQDERPGRRSATDRPRVKFGAGVGPSPL